MPASPKGPKRDPKPDLPLGVMTEDIDMKVAFSQNADHPNYSLGDGGHLTFYKTARFGWCVATLPISRGKNGWTDRTYAIAENGAICTVGNGPHVLAKITVYLRKSRVDALRKWIDLYNTGLGNAGMIRDRRSTRRAQTSLARARNFWAS